MKTWFKLILGCSNGRPILSQNYVNKPKKFYSEENYIRSHILAFAIFELSSLITLPREALVMICKAWSDPTMMMFNSSFDDKLESAQYNAI